MVTELVTFKMESDFLNEVDNTVKNSAFQNRTEFIRSALREKVDDLKMKKAMAELAHLRGASKKKTSKKDYELIRDKAFEEIEKKLR